MKDEYRGCLIKESAIVTFEVATPAEYEINHLIEPKYNTNFNRSKSTYNPAWVFILSKVFTTM